MVNMWVEGIYDIDLVSLPLPATNYYNTYTMFFGTFHKDLL